MRQTPLPLLSDLVTGVLVRLCRWCDRYVLGGEACANRNEAVPCPPRAKVEREISGWAQTRQPVKS